MKKFFKYLFYSFGFLGLFLLCLFFKPSIYNNLICNAESSDSVVNFYDYNNNDLLYSIDVPYGVSLSDLSTFNLLQNSNFQGDISGTYNNPSIPSWKRYNGTLHLSRADNSNLLYLNGEEGNISSLGQSFNSFNPGHYYCGFYLSASSFPVNCFLRFYDETNSQFYLDYKFSLSHSGYYFSEFDFPQNVVTNSCRFMLVTYTGVQLELSYAYLSSFDYSYFNIDYINNLYNYNNNIFTNNTPLWSLYNNTGLFDFSTPITEDINLYAFDDYKFNNQSENLEAEVSYQESYYLLEKAINNIEYVHYKGQLKLDVKLDTSHFSTNFAFFEFSTTKNLFGLYNNGANTQFQSTTLSQLSFCSYGLNLGEYLNFYVCNDLQSDCVYVTLSVSNLLPVYRFYLIPNTGQVEFVFTPQQIYLNVRDIDTGNIIPFVLSGEIDDYIFYNGNDINDMNFNTNYFINLFYLNSPNFYIDPVSIFNHQTTFIRFSVISSLYNNSDKFICITSNFGNRVNIYSNDLYLFYTSLFQLNLYGDVSDDDIIFFQPFDFFLDLDNSGFRFTEFLVVIKKPVARVDNSLVIYNYGYNTFLNHTSQIKYELRRYNKYYDIVYNGSLENYKLIVIDNEFVRNSYFDEYIFLDFLIDNSELTQFDILGDYIGTYLGFDFNFVYYQQPLVFSGSPSAYVDYKPPYMNGDITFSLVPPKLVVPFDAWIYNAIIWLAFDCPLVSDMLGFMHLDKFLGAMMRIVAFYVDSSIGQFLVACLSFVLLWIVLKSLLPQLYSSGSAIYNNTQFAYNRKRAKKDKKWQNYMDKEAKYQEHKNKKKSR